ncbi:MAG: FtsW/RodA/SpoVE family cell cycle protein [Phormidium sp. BM_Day4_Bin.17]|nr:FtsW/RodA/SpoVE family cell cycle protein [Phormidium sp. BM_Day4_Bin.17]UCJ12304.1 MAG: FtsW/RodA/SpoVE family cell cycle protein [Phormidium sp. PBR-2020]
MKLWSLIPLYDDSVSQWSWEARLLRWLTFVWLGVGLLILFSASYPSAALELGDGAYYFKRQLLWLVVGLVVFNTVVHTPLHRCLAIARWGVLILLGLLLLILVPGLGTTVNGATRWISIGFIPIQPSELIKPFLILQGAIVFGRWNRLSVGQRLFWLGILILILGCVILQPNLSTTAMCGMMLWLMALAAGIPYRILLGTAGGGVLLAGLSLSFKAYQRRRVLSFLNPWDAVSGDGYQLVQSLLAVGSGGVWGNGYGMSQQKLFYLPIQDSDFIFAVFAEEFGFVGSLGLILFLIAYGTLALRVAMNARNLLSQLVAIGVMVALVGQSFINIAVATGTLPTTGLPLPLFSYGGSSAIASLMAAGLLVRVAREGSQAQVISLSPQPTPSGRPVKKANKYRRPSSTT